MRIRYYPVTVSAEKLSKGWEAQPLGASLFGKVLSFDEA